MSLDLLGSIDFWRGAGRFFLILALLYAMFIIVLSFGGHLPSAWPFRKPKPCHSKSGQLATASGGAPDPGDGATPTAPHRASSHRSSEAHLEYLDRLRTSLKYQGSTVVLIVFAVIILGLQRVLGATEIATIVSGIAGFVLGQSKVQADAGGQPTDPGHDGGSSESHNGREPNPAPEHPPKGAKEADDQ